jgi:hypothetical protein
VISPIPDRGKVRAGHLYGRKFFRPTLGCFGGLLVFALADHGLRLLDFRVLMAIAFRTLVHPFNIGGVGDGRAQIVDGRPHEVVLHLFGVLVKPEVQHVVLRRGS